MKFDLNQGTGEWFPYFGSEVKEDGTICYLDPEKDGGKVQVRIADPETMEKIFSQTRTKVADNVYNPKTRAMERLKYTDQTTEQERLERELIWDHAIMAWEGILDKKGEPIPCTPENKMKLMSVPSFARFIGRCLTLFSMSAEERQKALEKN